MKKEKIESAVCRKFIELYNKRFSTDFLIPTTNPYDPPDCISKSKNNPSNIIEMEVTTSSPLEMEELNNRKYNCISDDTWNYPIDLPAKFGELLLPIEKKASKYDSSTKRHLFLLLQESSIKLDKGDTYLLQPLITETVKQEELKKFGT